MAVETPAERLYRARPAVGDELQMGAILRAVPGMMQHFIAFFAHTRLWRFAQTGGQGEPEGGPFIKFSFATGEVTDSETDWDIAFRGTTIAVNGGVATGANEEPARNGEAGAAIQSGTFGEITTADGLSFSQDAEGAYAVPTGSDNGWYNYNPATFTIAPIPGRILVFRTHDGRFAKVEILSYYRDAPAEPDPFTDESRVYTFQYVYNPNNGETTLAE